MRTHAGNNGIGAIAATSAALLVAAPLPAASPAPFWRDVTSVGVTCLVRTPQGVDTGARTRALCEAVRRHAARGAPVPVVAASLGGEALRAGRVTLLVQANVAPIGGKPVMALSLRPFRNAGEPGPLFVAPPRAIPADDAAALDAAVRAMLAETLPWQGRTT